MSETAPNATPQVPVTQEVLPPLPQQPESRLYATLPPADADFARQAAGVIRANLGRIRERIVEVGRTLHEVRSRLDRDQFRAWLDAEFEMTGRTMRNYLSAAAFADANPEIVSALPVTALYKLGSPKTPESVRREVVQRVQSGEPPAISEVNHLISEARKTEAEDQRIARLPEPDRKKAEARRKRKKTMNERAEREREEYQRQEEIQKRAAEQAAAAVAPLVAHLPGLLDRLKEADGYFNDALIAALEERKAPSPVKPPNHLWTGEL